MATSSFFSLIQIVATSDQVALLPRRLAEQFTDRLQLTEPPIAVEGFSAILSWHQRTERDPVRLWVAQELTAFADQF